MINRAVLFDKRFIRIVLIAVISLFSVFISTSCGQLQPDVIGEPENPLQSEPGINTHGAAVPG